VAKFPDTHPNITHQLVRPEIGGGHPLSAVQAVAGPMVWRVALDLCNTDTVLPATVAVPGPAAGANCQAQHAVNDWADDGQTNIDDLTLACPKDNRNVKPGGWTTRKLPTTRRRRRGLTGARRIRSARHIHVHGPGRHSGDDVVHRARCTGIHPGERLPRAYRADDALVEWRSAELVHDHIESVGLQLADRLGGVGCPLRSCAGGAGQSQGGSGDCTGRDGRQD